MMVGQVLAIIRQQHSPNSSHQNFGVHEARKTRIQAGSGATDLDNNFVMPKRRARVRRLLTSFAALAHLGRERSRMAFGVSSDAMAAPGDRFSQTKLLVPPALHARPGDNHRSATSRETRSTVGDLRHREKWAFNTSVYAS